MRGITAAAAILSLLVPMQADAGPIDPFGFASLGAFPATPGDYTISGTTLTTPGGSKLNGVVFSDSPGHSLAVFDFDSFNLAAGSTITGFGSLPLVLLSRTDMTIGGAISVSGTYPAGPSNPAAGAEATNAGIGSNHMDTFTHTQEYTGGGGGGFGGSGQSGGSATMTDNNIVDGLVPGGVGGPAHGNLFNSLQGGSGGASSPLSNYVFSNAGGGIELGSAGTLTLTGAIEANGASGGYAGGGGGAGGGVFLHATAITLTGHIDAEGGAGGPAEFSGRGGTTSGGAGGGGEVAILQLSAASTISISSLLINVSGAQPGTIETLSVPEPSSWILSAIGFASVAGLAWRRRAATSP